MTEGLLILECHNQKNLVVSQLVILPHKFYINTIKGEKKPINADDNK
jgi:hypothetical protein